MTSRWFAATAALTAGLLAVGVMVPTTATAAEDSAVLQLSKVVNGTQTDFQPGDTFSYEIQVGCSSTIDSICAGLVLEDALPDPLVFDPSVANPVVASLSPTGPVDIQVDQDDNSFTAAPRHTGSYEGMPVTGLTVGGTMLVTVSVMVPTTTGGDFNNQTITNTAAVDAENALEVTSTADITLDVETTLVASITKSASSATVPAVPGRTVDWTIAPGNASNQSVGQIVMQDPAVLPGGLDPYFDITGVEITAPATTASQTVEYYVEGAWTATAPDPLSDADGVRVTFDGTYAPGVSGSVVIHTVTTDAVQDIPTGDTETITNTAQSTVTQGGDTSDPVTDDATVAVTANDPDVAITKSFADNTLVSGQSTVATITATNGVQDVQRLTVTEPSAGQPGFTEQGLVFDGFGDDIAWPIAATEASITYTGPGCAAGPQSTTTQHTLPAPPAGCTVDGFTVSYTADGDDILASSYATLPLEVTAIARDEATPLASTNHVDTEVENTSGQTGEAAADASFTVAPLLVDTEVSKDITPSQVWGVAGADANISLSGKVADDSTVGSDYLIISDPADPTAPDSAAFWDAFTPVDIDNTDIADCTKLTLNYWSEDAGAWMPLPGAVDVQGPLQGYSYAIPADITDIGGIQYVFEPTCLETLPPGFAVITNLGVEVAQAHDVETIYTNDVQSQVDNENSLVREPTDEAEDQIQVDPLTGDGPDFVDKAWLEDDVLALSGQERTARLLWSTQGLNITEMTITDPSTQGQLDDVSTSVYDAFDLVRIPAITPATDPLIVNDIVSEVWLYLDGSGWTDVTSEACADGCTGSFGGFDLVDAGYSEDTLGVRIVFQEREAGAGVGSSYDRRPLDLEFRLRDTRRSDASEYVLGTFHPYTYNTGDPGVVNNTVSAQGVGPGVSSTSTDADTISIIDSPINVGLTKTFDQTQLGLPAAGTAADSYPLITSRLVATNRSAAKVASIRIDDAAPGQVDPTAFDVLDLHKIELVGAPTGLALSDASVTLTHSGGDVTYTAAAAAALTPAQLADVTAFSVVFSAADGRPVIAAGGAATIDLVWQLRADKRSGGPVEVTGAGEAPILNEAHTLIDSPGRIDCPATGCSTGEAVASDDFTIVAAAYAIRTAKVIAPESIPENGSTSYTTTLTGQPLGTARTTLFTLTDTTPTFWNTMDFVSLQIAVPQPVNEIKVDALIGAELVLDGTDLVAMCDGSPVDASSSCWVQGSWTAVSGTALLTLPATVNPADVVGIRMHARRVVAGVVVQWERPFNPTLNYRLTTERRDTVRSDPSLEVSTTRPGLQPNPGETAQGVISNELEADSTGQFGADQVFTAHEEAQDSTIVTHLRNAIRVTKTRGSSPLVNPAGNINYVMTIANTGQWDMTGFEVVDQIGVIDGASPLVEPDPAAYTFSVSGPGAPTGSAGFSASLDEATGELSIVNADPDFVFRSGWTLTVGAPLKFRDGLSPDLTVVNTVTATADRDFETCQSTTTDMVPKPVASNVSTCSADTTVAPRASAPVAMKKWVKGDGAGDPATGADDLGVYNVTGPAELCDPATAGLTDDGFYSYPCIPITRPGGEASWRLDFTNTGNTNARVIAAVDTLPHVGDQGVIVPSARGSQFPVTLTGLGSANWAQLADAAFANAAVYYSNSVQSQACNQNAIQVYTNDATANPACAFDWQVFDASTTEAELVDARSVLVVVEFSNPDATVPAPGLRPGETLSLTVNTRTPWALPAESAVASGVPIAYNSFAGASRTVATATQPERAELVLEPQRVGIGTATGQLQLTKIVEAPAYSGDIDLPATYPMLVTCVSGGEEVDLMFADGSDASRPAVPGDGSLYIYDDQTGPVNLPLFAECSLIEDPVPPGASVEIAPGSVIADRDIAETPSVFNPYTGDLEATQIDIVNTFAAGGFTVTKAVDDGGAVDQNGTPIAYDQAFGFEATCTYLGQEALAVVDRSFELVDGATKEITGIPAGAECTVTETGAGAAVGTTTVLTTGTADPVVGTGTSVDFTILDGDASTITAAFTNVFAVGSLGLTKVVTGDAAADFGHGPFTLHVTCTLEAAGPDTVYDADVILGGVLPLTTQIDDLPTGAECTVVETDTAGATSTTVAGSPAVVGDGTVVAVTVTNEFTSAPLTVTKQIDGDGAPLYGAGPFEVTLACLDASGADAAIPGGATRELNAQNGYRATYEPLLVGLECSLAETDTGGATSTTIVDAAGDAVDGPFVVPGNPFEISLTNTFDLGSLVVTKTISGPEAGSHRDDAFEVTVTCTLNGQIIVMPGGAVRTISVGAPAEFEDLPIGAECVVVETDAGDAESATLTPADPDDPTRAIVTIGADQAASVIIDNHFGAILPVTGAALAGIGLGGVAAVLALVGGIVLLINRRQQA